MKAKQPATNITGTVANPSRPSVKLTALDEPTIINTENDEYMGRWWLGIYSTDSDYNQEKHTVKPASI